MNHSIFLTLKKDDETHELVIDTSETFDDGLVKSELIDDEPTVKRIKFDQIWARSPFEQKNSLAIQQRNRAVHSQFKVNSYTMTKLKLQIHQS